MIAIGCDHAGFDLKKSITHYFAQNNIIYKDFGTYSHDSCDYPIFAKRVARSILSGECEKGILICATGIGISICANKFKGIRAALCSDTFSAHATREHNDANILALGARVIGSGLALDIVKIFLETPFSNESKHIARINQIEN